MALRLCRALSATRKKSFRLKNVLNSMAALES